VRIERIRIQDLRVLQQVELSLEPGINVLFGPNGSGKTSFLEAVHLLGYGRSFRSGGRDVLVRRGADAAVVFAELCRDDGGLHRLGIERSGSTWRGRVDDSEVGQLSDLYRVCAVSCFEPGSHELMSGGAELRRSMFDWGVFHVEPAFLSVWRRYQRALRQRNALLRDRGPDALFDAWEHEMAEAGAAIDLMRTRHAEVLSQAVVEVVAEVLPEFSGATFQLMHGWRTVPPLGAEAARDRLAEERGRDRERGFSRRGPHRADWSLGFAEIARREYLSRGQEKLCALAMILAQLLTLRRHTGEWPVLLLDDLASELDEAHQARVLNWLTQAPLQVLVTGVAVPPPLRACARRVFHVEQGRITVHH